VRLLQALRLALPERRELLLRLGELAGQPRARHGFRLGGFRPEVRVQRAALGACLAELVARCRDRLVALELELRAHGALLLGERRGGGAQLLRAGGGGALELEQRVALGGGERVLRRELRLLERLRVLRVRGARGGFVRRAERVLLRGARGCHGDALALELGVEGLGDVLVHRLDLLQLGAPVAGDARLRLGDGGADRRSARPSRASAQPSPARSP
jgi:hypothetical protein